MDVLSADYPILDRRDVLSVLWGLSVNYAHDPEGWQNRTIPEYLDAMIRWIETSDGYYRNRGEDAETIPDLRLFADALRAGRVYE